MSDQESELEAQIRQWRTYLCGRQAVDSSDLAELEDHLREQIAFLVGSGLAADEALFGHG